MNTMDDPIDYSPATLARTTPHSLSSWSEAYRLAGQRWDWPQIAKAIIDLSLHPSAVVWLTADVDAESELKTIAETASGRFMQLGTEVRSFGQAVIDSFPRWLRARARGTHPVDRDPTT